MLGAAQTGVAALLAGRMGYIAIAENERYRGLAESNRVQTRLIPPRRGWIVDRHGQPMAINRADIRVDLIPDFIEDKDALIAELTRLLGLPPEEVQRIRTELDRGGGFQPVPVAEHLTQEQYYAVSVREPELPGVSVLRGFSRYYPEGAAVGHLIGYVGTPNRRDYEAENRNPLLITPGFKVGKEGLEKVMEPRLRGQPGQARVEVTARGRLVRELQTLPDSGGHAAQDHDRRRPAELRRAPAGRAIGQLRHPRLQQRRHPRSGLDARLRPEQLLRRHQPFGMGHDGAGPAPSADQQGAERALSARLDLQAGGGDGADGDRRRSRGDGELRRRLHARQRGASAASACTDR